MSSKKKTKKRKKTRQPTTSIKQASFDVNKLFAMGVQYQRKGRLNKADKIYTKILNSYPDFPDCLHLKGFVSYELGRNEIAIDFITKAIKRNPDNFTFHYNLSLPFLAQNKLDEAISCLEKAILLHPDLIQAHVNLGNIFQEQGRFNKAISQYKRALQLNPNDPLVHMNMGNILTSQKKYGHAISSYEKALEFKPDFEEAYYNMGNAYKVLGKIEEAISCYQKAIEINPQDANAYSNMGHTCMDLNKLDDAERCYQKAIEIRPDGIEFYYNLGNVIQNQGKFEEARSWYRKALKLKPDCAEAFYFMTRGMRVTQNELAGIIEIANKLKEVGLSEDGHIYMNFALGKVYDDLGMYEEAFHHYQDANNKERSKHTYDSNEHRAYISRILKSFNSDFFVQHDDWGNLSQRPIFIVGMPRSGTSLVEQIISSHPKVFGAGELDFFNQYENRLVSERNPSTYPEYMDWFDRQAASILADSYLDFLENLSGPNGSHLHVTDKMPHNFLFLGLLYAIFPKARFIHCQRTPLDNCLSIYFQKFTGHPYSYNLKELGLSYIEYKRLMKHWDEVLPNVVYHVRYEDLVTKQEELSRQLIDFCGLDWDSRCLDFHKSNRPVFTNSNWQVRQPIYKSAVNRWKNYSRFLDPLKELLSDSI